MIFSNKITGDKGEQDAVLYLKRQRYKILFRNYRTNLGEIDIIAKDGRTLCFVEVKARRNNNYGYAAEAVTTTKQNKIRQLAESYIQEHNIENINVRFDVVSIDFQDSKTAHIELIKNAFV